MFKKPMMLCGGALTASLLAACGPMTPPPPPPGAMADTTMMSQYLQQPLAMQAVNLCSDSPAGRAAYVTDVALTPGTNIRVTLVDIMGERRTCTVDPAAQQIISYDVTGRDVNQVFIPVKLSPNEPRGNCLASQRVVQNGNVQGWLLRRDPTDKCRGVDWLTQLRPAPKK